MRILFHHRIASRDGQSVHIEEMIAALHRQGHETLLVGPPSFMATGFGRSDQAIDRIKRALPASVFEVLEVAYNVKAYNLAAMLLGLVTHSLKWGLRTGNLQYARLSLAPPILDVETHSLLWDIQTSDFGSRDALTALRPSVWGPIM